MRRGSIAIVLALAFPVLIEQLLHTAVGFTDTYLAAHLNSETGLTGTALDSARIANASATAAVGSVAYVLWFVNHLAASLGIGATALISRAIGARHRSLAHAVCGQVVMASVVLGVVVGTLIAIFAYRIAPLTGLPLEAQGFFASYVRLLAIALPLTLLMLIASACLRGAGDTLTPMYALVVVDIVNVVMSVGLTYGLWYLPRLGFNGIAVGTVIAYACGGMILFYALVRGRGGLRLYLHRLWPRVDVLRRVMRIGLPGGAEMMLQWGANVGVLLMVNSLGSVAAAAHTTAIRLEAFSYLMGMAFSTAAATLVGQSLGRGDVMGARKFALTCYLLGGGVMTSWGIAFILLGPYFATWLSEDPAVQILTGQCLQITGVIQFGFAAVIILGGAMRGAGDTKSVMFINLGSIIFVRLLGVLIVVKYAGFGLLAVWIILSGELLLRGILLGARFKFGGWYKARV